MTRLHRVGVVAVFIVAGFAAAPGCGDDDDGTDVGPDDAGDTTDGGADADADVGADADADADDAGADADGDDDDGGGGDTTRACPGCAATSGCLAVEVTREADTSMQPWVVWPTEADGTGTLIVSALQGTTVVARETYPGADMTGATASYTVPLCVPPGESEVRVFLDDDLDAAADATYSADYLDSCMGEHDGCFRCIRATAAAGEDVPVTAPLRGSCD